ncbi:hypothetical protein FRX94_04300 [Corynebacterium canis]|uniref:Lantibiotic dehydratase n=1 Tax=Corynebacterium canis TaxID=679663 RepID=A0A5C5ULU5_9CORY|nr:thiopeptide-type bacteriocin biosynthesis protein [Corynebacterium canis]TWT26829.1 hypothetical protein FRX94_04300 [Corynebacterium canis]WJY74457.1 hypothetical protein CCANI_03000 [Corynebacterium canis]
MTYQLQATVQGIRSAAVRWEEYQRFLGEQDGLAQIRLAYENPTIRTMLAAFSPIIDANVRAVLAGELRLDSKKGRKTLRHVSTLMARAASRATPSRLVGRVGQVYETLGSKAESGDSTERLLEIVLRDELEIGCATPITVENPVGGAPSAVRWNPSVIAVGARYFVTAPRTRKEVFESVGKNDVIDRIVALAQQPILWDRLVGRLAEEFHVGEVRVVEKAVLQLVKKEFLLSTHSVGYVENCSEQGVDKRVRPWDRLDGSVRQWVVENRDAEFETRRDAWGYVGAQALDSLEKCFAYILRHRLVDTSDQGVAKHFAEMLHERYGYSRISFVDLIHPAFGVSYQDVIDEFSARRRAEVSPVFVELCAWAVGNDKRWIDLNAPEVRDIVARGDRAFDVEYSDQFESFAVPVVPQVVGATSYNEGSHNGGTVQFIVCDGVVATPSNTLTARYRLLDNSGADAAMHHGSLDSMTVGLDWMSNDRKVNAIREFKQGQECMLNVNAFATAGEEMVCQDLYLWSDGERVFLEHADGTRLNFEPASMVSIHLYPDWVRLLYLVSTANWPAMQWHWGTMERYHDFLPGIRFDNVILQRPKYRYRGEKTLEVFNAWCDKLGISIELRLGTSDRKVLVNRNTISDISTLRRLLGSGDNWVEDAGADSGIPLCTDSDGFAVHSELVVSFQCVHRERAAGNAANSHVQDNAVGGPVERPKFGDVNTYGFEQLIPAISEWCNLEIVPRGGDVNPLIALLAKLPIPFYFVRYTTQAGKTCLRLRLLREHIMRNDVRDFFGKLVWDGWVSTISEQQHRLEVERYGGSAAFAAFTELFIAESALVSWLSAKKLLEPLSAGERAFLLRRWLHASPLSYGTQIQAAEQQAERQMRRGGKQRVEIPGELPELLRPYNGQIDQYFEAISGAMGTIAPVTQDHAEPWAVAAHLFCNRLGISTDDERQVWKALAKTAPALERA